MKVSYYPGCTLRNKAKKLDYYARESAKILGFELCEVENWQCCGGAFTSSSDEIATKLSSVRALKSAYESDRPLITVCSACHNVLKRTNAAMQNDKTFANRVNNYMAQDEDFSGDYNGEATIYHYLEYLRDVVTFEKVKEKVVSPLTGMKIAPYYGCLLLRPSKVMNTDDPENPSLLEDLISALGGEVIKYPQRNECCGGYMAVEDKQAAEKQSNRITKSALSAGAEVMLTACPLCRYNLMNSENEIPVLYFTELLAKALGVEEV